MTDALLADADQFTWVAAAVGANSAAGYQLATERPVMAIGGFNGSDPAPTLAEFQARVGAGGIHYFISGGQGFGGGQMGGSQSASEIAAWVAQNFAASTVDSVTLYDLTAPTTASGAGAAVQGAVGRASSPPDRPSRGLLALPGSAHWIDGYRGERPPCSC